MRSRELRVALLVLRVGLGVFLLLWSIDKMVAPEQTAKIFQFFYKTALPASFAPAVGALGAALSLAFLAGLWKTWTYGACLALHAISTLSTSSRPSASTTSSSPPSPCSPPSWRSSSCAGRTRSSRWEEVAARRRTCTVRPDAYSGSATPTARQRSSSERRSPHSRSGATAW